MSAFDIRLCYLSDLPCTDELSDSGGRSAFSALLLLGSCTVSTCAFDPYELRMVGFWPISARRSYNH